MTRIIGGVAGSRKLIAPAKSTRPTSDRVRESIFNRLEARTGLDGFAVLDLYAGTGALALEALSRGAARALLVESGKAAAQVCKRNSELVGLDGLKVIERSVMSFLAAPSGETAFDLVFIDPPYEVSNDEVSHNLEELLPLLAPEATVVLERASRSGEVELPDGYELEDTKNYGDTTVFWISLA